jgi:hypothetical protein
MPPWIERELVADCLLDVGGVWRWITGTARPVLQRVPKSVQQPPEHDVAPTPVAEPDDELPRLPSLPVRWIEADAGLRDACERLRHEDAVNRPTRRRSYRPIRTHKMMALAAANTRAPAFCVFVGGSRISG